MEFLAENIAQNTTTTISQADAPNGVFKADRAGVVTSVQFRFGNHAQTYPNSDEFFIYEWALYNGSGNLVFSDNFSSYDNFDVINSAPYDGTNIGQARAVTASYKGSLIRVAELKDTSNTVNSGLIFNRNGAAGTNGSLSLASGRMEAKIMVSATMADSYMQIQADSGQLARVAIAPSGAVSLLDHTTLSTTATVPTLTVKDVVITWTGATATQAADMTITIDGENIFHDYGDLFSWRTDVALQKIPPKLAFSAGDYAKINYAILFSSHTSGGLLFTKDLSGAVPSANVQKITNNEITLNFGNGVTGKTLWLGNKQELQGSLAPGSTYPIRENYKRYISTNQVGQFHEIRADIKGTPYRIQLNNIPSNDNALGDMLDQIRTLPFFVKLLTDWHLVYENSPETSLPTLQTTPAHLQIVLNLITIPR